MDHHPLYSRFRPLLWLGIVFLAVSALSRLALLLATGGGVPATFGNWAYAFGVGLGYDLLTFVYFAWPLLLLLWLLPRRWLARRWGSFLVGALCLLLLFVMLFVAVSEWTFWEEFQARFNFIAVDYLVYTTEVIGNIRESYPVGWILSALALVGTGLFVATRRWRLVRNDSAHFGARSLVAAAWLALSVLGTWLVTGDMKDRTGNTYVNELAGNGIYQFFAAYRSASLDYPRYYRTIPADEAVAQSLAALRWLQAAGSRQIYFKYCSTFDSTPQGNIGPVTEALMDALGCDFTIATPAFPDNGRTVFKGHLFVGDVLLSESGMRDQIGRAHV